MKLKLVTLLASLLILSSCGTNYNRSGPGLIFTDTTDALSYDNSVTPSKTGKACSKRILAFVAYGDASTAAAKRDGGISRVASIDTQYLNILGLYGEACTVVRGQ